MKKLVLIASFMAITGTMFAQGDAGSAQSATEKNAIYITPIIHYLADMDESIVVLLESTAFGLGFGYERLITDTFSLKGVFAVDVSDGNLYGFTTYLSPLWYKTEVFRGLYGGVGLGYTQVNTREFTSHSVGVLAQLGYQFKIKHFLIGAFGALGYKYRNTNDKDPNDTFTIPVGEEGFFPIMTGNLVIGWAF